MCTLQPHYETRRITSLHELQMKIPKSKKKIALDRRESMPAITWSDFESIALSEIVSSFLRTTRDYHYITTLY